MINVKILNLEPVSFNIIIFFFQGPEIESGPLRGSPAW